MIDPATKTWIYAYDTYGDKTSITDPLGDRTTNTYNTLGQQLTLVTPKGNIPGCGCAGQYMTQYGHDAFGNITTTTDPLHHITTRHYDPNQNLDYVIDADNNKTTYTYDKANELTVTKRANLTTLRTDYNLDGTVLDQKDGKGTAIQTYGYNALAQATSVKDALGNTTSYTYDGVGNRLTSRIRAAIAPLPPGPDARLSRTTRR